MRSYQMLLLLSLASIADPTIALAEAGGGRTEAGGSFMSSYRPTPSGAWAAPIVQPLVSRPPARARPRRR
jgi:hypothetical protein